MQNNKNNTRREFVKKAGYAAPALLTWKAAPALSMTGSVRQPREPQRDGKID